MAGGVTEYAATNARVRSMYSTLLSPQSFLELYEAPDFNTLVAVLKRTPYGPNLERVAEKDLTPRRVAFQIRSRLASAYEGIIISAPVGTRPLLMHLYRQFEINNLKAVLRGILAGASWNRVRYLLFPLGEISSVPAQLMLEAGSVAAAVELLRGGPYYETLSHAMKRFSAEQTLFPLEVTLDLNYWRSLWSYVIQLTGQDRTQAMRVIGPLIDMANLMWAIRYREYHHLSEEELINYTLPIGYHVHDEDIRSIAAGADIARVVQHIYPDLPDLETLLDGSGSGLAALEVMLQREVLRQCQAVLTGNPFHIGVPLAYLTLHKMEIQDLTVLIEAKSTHVPSAEFRSYLLLGPQPERA